MWWYYKCVNLVRVLYRGKNKLFFVTWKCLAKTSRAGGAPPRTDALIGPAACGQCPNPDSLKQRAVRARSLSLEHGLTLLNMAWLSWISELSGTPWSYASRFRNCALQCAPVRWTLTSEPTIGRSLRPCQSRNITEQRIQRLQSRGELSRWRHAAVSSLHTRATEEARTDHVTNVTEQPKEHVELTRENETKKQQPA